MRFAKGQQSAKLQLTILSAALTAPMAMGHMVSTGLSGWANNSRFVGGATPVQVRVRGTLKKTQV